MKSQVVSSAVWLLLNSRVSANNISDFEQNPIHKIVKDPLGAMAKGHEAL